MGDNEGNAKWVKRGKLIGTAVIALGAIIPATLGWIKSCDAEDTAKAVGGVVQDLARDSRELESIYRRLQFLEERQDAQVERIDRLGERPPMVLHDLAVMAAAEGEAEDEEGIAEPMGPPKPDPLERLRHRQKELDVKLQQMDLLLE